MFDPNTDNYTAAMGDAYDEKRLAGQRLPTEEDATKDPLYQQQVAAAQQARALADAAQTGGPQPAEEAQQQVANAGAPVANPFAQSNPYAANIGDANRFAHKAQAQSAESAQQIDKAAQTQHLAIQRQAEVAKAQSDAEAQVMAHHAANQQRVQDAEAGIQAQRQQFVQNWDNQYKAAYDDWKNTQTDSERWVKEHRARAIVATLLGGIGMAVAGRPGENPGLDMVNRMIERDIAEQESNRQQKGQALGEMRHGRQDALNEFGAQMDDQALTHTRNLEAYKDALDKVGAEFKAPQAQAAAMKLSGELDQQIAQQKNSLAQQALGAEQTALGVRSQSRLAEGAAMAAQAEAEAKARAKAKEDEKGLEGYQRVSGTTVTEQGFNKAQEIVAGKMDMENQLTQALALREKFGSETLPTEAKATMELYTANIATALAGLNASGVLSEKEYERYKNMVGQAAGYGWQANKLRALKTVINTRANAKLRAYGFVPQRQANNEAVGFVPNNAE